MTYSLSGWDAAEWTAQDDQVRGGTSSVGDAYRAKRDGQSSHRQQDTDLPAQSCLDLDNGKARFHGNLDIETLGGAGFASQRTTAEDTSWDLSDYAGIQLEIAKGDSR